MTDAKLVFLIFIPLAVVIAGILFEIASLALSKQRRDETKRRMNRFGIRRVLRETLTVREREEDSMKNQATEATTSIKFHNAAWLLQSTSSAAASGHQASSATKYFVAVPLLQSPRMQPSERTERLAVPR